MKTSKIIKAYIGAGTYSTTDPITQGDYGYILQIEGTVLPATYRVDFANDRHDGEALTVYGNENGAEVPEELIATGKDIFAFYYYIGENFGKTAYTWKIPNDTRANAGDREPTPTQQDSIDQLIVRSNEAVEIAEQKAEEASTSAQSASDSAIEASRSESRAQTHALNAERSSTNADLSANDASESAEAAARSANQSAQIKTDVESLVDDAHGYAQASAQSATASANSASQASGYAQSASASAQSASGYASNAQTSAQSASADADRAEQARDTTEGFASVASTNASESAQSAVNALTSARMAEDAKTSAQASAQDAQDSAEEAQGYASASAQSASASANSASQAQGYANTASASAQSASTSASAALTYANTASTKAQDASGYAQTASQKATESAQSASQALGYKNDAESAKTASQTAQGLVESARDSAVSAKTDAESARDDAVQAKEDAESAVASISGALDDKAPVITDSASGAIASFSDGANDLPLKSLIVDINPVQDLHGQDAPYPAGGGANKWDEEWETGWIGWSGQNADNPDRIRSKGFIPVSEGSEYRVVTSNNLQFFYYDSNKNFISYETSSKANQSTLTIPTGCAYIRFYTYGTSYGGTYKNDIAINYPSSVTTYSPYENICPISGWTSVDVEQSGVNVWDEEWEVGDISASTGESAVSNTVIRTKNYILVKPNTKYFVYINDSSSSGPLRSRFYGINKDFIGTAPKDRTAVTYNQAFTTPDNCYYMRFTPQASYGTTYNHDISINYPSSDHSYHPYTGRSITINLGQTVYGGKLDVLSGILTVDRAMVDLGTLDWYDSNTTTDGINRFGCSVENLDIKLPSANNVRANMICDRYTTETADGTYLKRQGIAINASNKRIFVFDPQYNEVTDFKASFDHLYLCYELAEPITIQLTPNQINSLYGVNNLWADSGDIEAVYRADTKLFIERLTAPDSVDMVADANITSGQYFMVGNSLYKATANIANGGQITVGTNCTRVSLAQALNEINA